MRISGERLRTEIIVPRWLRFIVHNLRCRHWRKHRGPPPTYTWERQFLASCCWRDTGHWPTENEIRRIRTEDWIPEWADGDLGLPVDHWFRAR